LGDPSIRGHPLLCDLCDLCVDGLFWSEFLHTEIAKVAKTDSVWVALRSVVIRLLCDLCDLCVDGLFWSEFLHTEIAKVAKTDSVWVALRSVVIRSFVFFAISVWDVFSGRSFYTRRSQRSNSD
jgi:hypothetical protein